MVGFILLGLFIVIEIALLAITFTKQKEKKHWLQNRIIFRVGEVVLFLLALLLPQAAWNFRFKMCFFILIIRLVTALVICAIKRKKVTGSKSKIGAVVNMIFGILLLTLSLTPAFLFTDYEGLETTGSYNVKHVSAILKDKSRLETFETDGSEREVPVHFYYPETKNDSENSFPLVIFSHGAFGYYQSNCSTYMQLASHGYVVISLDHPYHSFFTQDTEGKLITVDSNFLQEVMLINEENISEEEILELSHKWLTIRTDDINFVLDSVKTAISDGNLSDAWYFPSEDAKYEIFQVLAMADVEEIGLMGHSLGGAASVTVGRERDDINAVIDLDGTMLGEQLTYENGEYQYYDEPYPVPILSIDDEEHYIQGKEIGNTEALYVNNVILENAVESTHTYFVGSGHMNFTDLPLFSPALASFLGTGSIDETECIETMNEIILEFFNCYLKDEGEVIIKESY